MLKFSGSLSILAAIVIGLFISEKIIDRDQSKGLIYTLKIIPTYLSNKRYLRLIFLIVITHSTPRLVAHIISQQIIKRQFDRALYTNVELVIQPLMIFVSIFVFRLIKRGRIIRLYMISQFLHVSTALFSLLALIYWESTHNKMQMFFMLIGANLFGLMGSPETFLYAYANLTIDQSLGNTGIAIIQVAFNLTGSIPQTLGLFLVQYFDFYTYSFTVVGLSFLMLLLSLHFSQSLSSAPFSYLLRPNLK